jgi:hypothetical protein
MRTKPVELTFAIAVVAPLIVASRIATQETTRPSSPPTRIDPVVEIERFLGEPPTAPLELWGEVKRRSHKIGGTVVTEQSEVTFRFDGERRFYTGTDEALPRGEFRRHRVVGTDEGLWRGEWVEAPDGQCTGTLEIEAPAALDIRIALVRKHLQGLHAPIRMIQADMPGSSWVEDTPMGARIRRLRMDLAWPTASSAPDRTLGPSATVCLWEGRAGRIDILAVLGPFLGQTRISAFFSFTRTPTFDASAFEIRPESGIEVRDLRTASRPTSRPGKPGR